MKQDLEQEIAGRRAMLGCSAGRALPIDCEAVLPEKDLRARTIVCYDRSLEDATMTRMFHMAAKRHATSASPKGENARLDACVRFTNPSSSISKGYHVGSRDQSWDSKRGAAM